MVLEFLFLFKPLNLSFLSKDKKKEVIKKTEITITKAVVLFEYRKANKKYWDRPRLY